MQTVRFIIKLSAILNQMGVYTLWILGICLSIENRSVIYIIYISYIKSQYNKVDELILNNRINGRIKIQYDRGNQIWDRCSQSLSYGISNRTNFISKLVKQKTYCNFRRRLKLNVEIHPVFTRPQFVLCLVISYLCLNTLRVCKFFIYFQLVHFEKVFKRKLNMVKTRPDSTISFYPSLLLQQVVFMSLYIFINLSFQIYSCM